MITVSIVSTYFATASTAQQNAHGFWQKIHVLPNAMYGTWESAIYDYGRLNEVQKAEKRASSLEGFHP